MIILLLTGVQAFNFETKEEAETIGRWTVITVFALTLALPGVLFLCKRRKTKLPGLISIFLMLQLGRWSLLMSFRASDFFVAYWSEVNKFFDLFDLYKINDEPPGNSHFGYLGIETSSFIGNTDEIQLGVLLCLSIVVFLRVLTKDKRCWRLLCWVYLVTATDIFLYCHLQLDYFSSSSALSLVSSLLAITAFLLYNYMLLNTIGLICKDEQPGNYTKFYLQEFKKNKLFLQYSYYPIFLALRNILALLLVYCGEYPIYQFAIIVSLEGLVIVYLVVVRPYKSKVNVWFSVFYHSAECLILTLPYLYEESGLSEIVLDNALVWLVWAVILAGIARNLLDSLIIPKKTTVVPIRTRSNNTRDSGKEFVPVFVDGRPVETGLFHSNSIKSFTSQRSFMRSQTFSHPMRKSTFNSKINFFS